MPCWWNSMTFHDHSHFPWISRPGKCFLNSMTFQDVWKSCIKHQLYSAMFEVASGLPVIRAGRIWHGRLNIWSKTVLVSVGSEGTVSITNCYGNSIVIGVTGHNPPRSESPVQWQGRIKPTESHITDFGGSEPGGYVWGLHPPILKFSFQNPPFL